MTKKKTYTVEWFDPRSDKWGEREFGSDEELALRYMDCLYDLLKSEGDENPVVVTIEQGPDSSLNRLGGRPS